MEMMVPMAVPKNSLNTAPVYPIIAETSSFNNIIIRAMSIGLNILTPIIIFSIGYSENWKVKNKINPSNNKAKYNQSIIEIPIPLALSRVAIALKNAIDTKITVIKLPKTSIMSPISFGAYISIGIPAPIKKANNKLKVRLRNRAHQILLLLMGCPNNNSINSALL